MQKKDLEALCDLLEQKAEFLEKYDGLSVRLLIDDFDKLEHLLDVRQGFLLEFNALTPKIDALVQRQPPEERDLLKAMLHYQNAPGADAPEWEDVRRMLLKMKALIDAINEKTRQTDARFSQYKQELMGQLQHFSKGQKVASYVGSASHPELFNGRRMDEKS